MKRLDELLDIISKEPFKEYGISDAEDELFKLMRGLRDNDRPAYINYLYKYNQIRNIKLNSTTS